MVRTSLNYPCHVCKKLTGHKSGLCVQCRTVNCLHCKKPFVRNGNKVFSHCMACRKSKKIMSKGDGGFPNVGDF